ncbi:MAG: YbaN family protein [Spirochaetes bacterium]|nr:YbaN family protein [Spirochaetota bacterium]
MGRYVFILLGTVSLGLGILGMFLPLLPTTPFLLCTAACYARGSCRFYNWLMRNRILGTYIRNYREQRGITGSMKVWVLLFLWTTILYSILVATTHLGVRLFLLGIAIAVTIHIVSLRTLKD